MMAGVGSLIQLSVMMISTLLAPQAAEVDRNLFPIRNKP